MFTSELLEQLKNNGGFSYNINTHDSPTSGYMVSLQGCEEVYYSEDITEDTIPGYITRYAKQLLIPGSYLGGWVDGETVYLDVSINIDDLQDALALARDNDQLAIFDLQAGESIYLDKPGRIEELYADLDVYDYREYLERLWSEEDASERESRSLYHLEDKYQYYE